MVDGEWWVVKKSPTCCYPPSTIHHPPSTIHHPPSTIHHPPSTIHHPPNYPKSSRSMRSISSRAGHSRPPMARGWSLSSHSRTFFSAATAVLWLLPPKCLLISPYDAAVCLRLR